VRSSWPHEAKRTKGQTSSLRYFMKNYNIIADLFLDRKNPGAEFSTARPLVFSQQLSDHCCAGNFVYKLVKVYYYVHVLKTILQRTYGTRNALQPTSTISKPR